MKLKFKISDCLLYIFAATYIMRSSAALRAMGPLNKVMIVIQSVGFIYYFVRCFIKRKPSKYLLTVIVFYIVLLISTITNGKTIDAFLTYFVMACGVTMMVEDEVRNGPVKFIRILRNILAVLIIVNLVSVIIYTEGIPIANDGILYDGILGDRIAFTPFIILFFLVTLLYDKLKNKNISAFSLFVIGCGGLTIIIQDISTGMIALAAAIILLILGYSGRPKLISYWGLFISFIIIFVAIVIFSVQYHIPYFSHLLVDVLGRDLTFDNRTVIWSTAIADIVKKPLLGYGMTTSGDIYVTFEYVSKTLTAHNQILHVLHEGGVIALCIFTAMFIEAGRKISMRKMSYISYLMMTTMFSVMLMMITEVQSQKALIFILLALAYYTNVFDDILVKRSETEEEQINEIQ